MPVRVVENIDAYMQSISEYPLISVDHEYELSSIIHGDDADAASKAINELVCANLRLVVKIAHDFSKYQLGFADLVAEGNIGLMRAAEKFDPSKGAKFSVYAGWWIKQAMRKAIADKTRTIRLPTEQAKRKTLLERCRSQWLSEHGIEPSDEELSDISGVPLPKIELLNRSVTETVSMDEIVSDSTDTSFSELLSIEDESEATRRIEARSEGLAVALSSLCARDREIIDLTYGLSGRIYSCLETAQEVGCSPSYVAERAKELLVVLRSTLYSLGVS